MGGAVGVRPILNSRVLIGFGCVSPIAADAGFFRSFRVTRTLGAQSLRGDEAF